MEIDDMMLQGLSKKFCFCLAFGSKQRCLQCLSKEWLWKPQTRQLQDFDAQTKTIPAAMCSYHCKFAKSERAKTEELAEFLYQQRELRLPTEPTYATMTALVSCNGTPSRFDLHSSLQTVKAAWRGSFGKLC